MRTTNTQQLFIISTTTYLQSPGFEIPFVDKNMSIADTDALAAALEGGDVPAQVGFPSFAGCLINNAKTVFDQPELREAFMV